MWSPVGARDGIAAGLVRLLGDEVTVYGFPRIIDQPTKPTVVLLIDGVRSPDVACAVPIVELIAWAVTPLTEPGPADDALDTLLGDVLTALDALGIAWTRADHGVWNTTHPAYKIALETRL